MKKMPCLCAFLFVFALLLPLNGYAAYSDDIGVKIEEVWQASRKVAVPYGIKKENYSKKEIETRWTEDRVVRSRGLLKGLASQTYRRRYRIKVKLAEQKDRTHIEVRGFFQEKPLDGPPSLSWRRVSANSQDYELEYEFFVKILKTLETLRSFS